MVSKYYANFHSKTEELPHFEVKDSISATKTKDLQELDWNTQVDSYEYKYKMLAIKVNYCLNRLIAGPRNIQHVIDVLNGESMELPIEELANII